MQSIDGCLDMTVATKWGLKPRRRWRRIHTGGKHGDARRMLTLHMLILYTISVILKKIQPFNGGVHIV